MEHSKGAWKVGENWGVVVTDNGEGFPKDSGHDACEFYGGFLIAESIAKKGDAKLIAAAPDLLEALQICTGEIERSPVKYSRSEKIEIAKAAIKKATE